MTKKKRQLLTIAALVAVFAFVAVFPVGLAPDDAVISIATLTLIAAVAVTGWNIFSGYTGYISLGHSVFYGFGAYTLSLLTQTWHLPGGWPPFLLLPLAGLVAGLAALPLGWVALRVRRHAFVVITIAFVFIFQLLAANLRQITNGSAGVFLPVTPWADGYTDLPFYYVALGVLLVAVLVSWWVRHSKFGLGLLAIRDDEDRARSLGVKTNTAKLTAYVISAVFVGMAGAIFGYFVGIVYPEFSFDPVVDITIGLMAFSGGLGSVAGPLLGALFVIPLQQELSLRLGGNGLDLVVYGGLFLAVLLLLPRGIVPSLLLQWRRVRQARRDALRKEQPALLAEPGRKGLT